MDSPDKVFITEEEHVDIIKNVDSSTVQFGPGWVALTVCPENIPALKRLKAIRNIPDDDTPATSE